MTISLLFAVTFGVFLLVVWYQRQAAAAQQMAQLRQTRLSLELRRELASLESRIAADPSSELPPQELLILALDNLLERGRNEELALHSQRQALLQLSRRPADPAHRQELRARVRQLSQRLLQARAWVRLLEDELLSNFRQREARRGPARPPPPPALPQPHSDAYVPAPIAPPGQASLTAILDPQRHPPARGQGRASPGRLLLLAGGS